MNPWKNKNNNNKNNNKDNKNFNSSSNNNTKKKKTKKNEKKKKKTSDGSTILYWIVVLLVLVVLSALFVVSENDDIAITTSIMRFASASAFATTRTTTTKSCSSFKSSSSSSSSSCFHGGKSSLLLSSSLLSNFDNNKLVGGGHGTKKVNNKFISQQQQQQQKQFISSSSSSSSSSSWFSSSSSLLTMSSLRGGEENEGAADVDSSSKRPFQTWSFDNACDKMEFTPCSSSRIDMKSVSKVSVDNDLADCDLIIIGVLAPSSSLSSSLNDDEKKEQDEDEEEEEEEENEDEDEDEKEVIPMELEDGGICKEIDDKICGGLLTQVIKDNVKEFKNGIKAGSVTPVVRVMSSSTGKIQKIVLLGMGKEQTKKDEGEDDDDDDDDDGADSNNDGLGSKLGSTIAKQCMNEQTVTKCTVILPSLSLHNDSNNDNENVVQSIVSDLSCTFHTCLYKDLRYKSKKLDKKLSAENLESVTLCVQGVGENAHVSTNVIEEGIKSGCAIANGIYMTKDIVNSPHNVLNSVSMANAAQQIANESEGGVLTCEILNKEECEKRGMGAFLGVARGSETEPKLIHLTYKPPPTPSESEVKPKKVGLVGKGLLFDTGGYNIKTQMMELMKFDCGGSAAVLGAARGISQLQPQGVEAHFVVAACSNMINSKAVVPSDILTASNGKTIEVMNTDAEGRLTLADALVYTDKELGCESIIELSTLTGACMISLGTKIAGLWTSNDKLANQLQNVSKITNEKIWRMPLELEYNEQLKSNFADYKNIGGRYGGAITAALFLQNFVSKKKPFAHLDIAGPVWNDKDGGATGFGAKLVMEWIKKQGKGEDDK